MSTVDTPQAQEHAPPAPTLSDRSNSFNSDRDVQDDNLADAGAPHAEQLQHDIMSRVVDDAPAREEGSDEAEPALNLSSAHSSPLSSHLDNAAPDILADNIAQDELSDRVAHSKPLSKKAERARKKSLSAVQPPISFHPLTEATFDIPPPAVPSKATPIAEPPTPKSALSPASSSEQDVPNVHLICLVGFDHAIGPNIEFSYPTEFEDEGELNKILPFLALPDGAHTREEDYSYFHILHPALAPTTLFGISCNRQCAAGDLINRGKEVTRSTVQKAVVVLASRPIFGPLRDKLGLITRAFFDQKDFDDKSLLVDLYESLLVTPPTQSILNAVVNVADNAGDVGGAGGENQSTHSKYKAREIGGEEEGMYMGTSLRELVYRFRHKTLMLLKLLMLQRKVMFYSGKESVESLCTFQYSLVSLIPSLLTQLEDSASPELNEREINFIPPSSLRTSDKNSLIAYLGLPLNIFGKGAFFQPYLPLQQIGLLKAESFLVGTTNSIILQQRDCALDVIINIETSTLEFVSPASPSLSAALALSPADRKWMDEIVSVVDSTWDHHSLNPNLNTTSTDVTVGVGFLGSEDYLRGKFEEYITSMLSSIKFDQFLESTRGKAGEDVLLSVAEIESRSTSSFNRLFIEAFKKTRAFEEWSRNTDEAIFDLVEPKHPKEGQTTPFSDVGIRLANGLHSLHLESHLPPVLLNPTRERIAESLATGEESLRKGMESASEGLWKGLERTGDWWKRSTAVGKNGGAGGEMEKTLEKGKGREIESPLMVEGPPASTALLAGVDQAKNLATNFGSFLKQRVSTSLAASTPPAPVSKDVGVDDDVKPALLSTTLSSFFSRPTPTPPPSSTEPLPSPLPTPTLTTWNTFDRFRRSISSSNPTSPISTISPSHAGSLPPLPVLPPLIPRSYSPVQSRRTVPEDRDEIEVRPTDLDARFEFEAIEEGRQTTPALLSPALPASPAEPEHPSLVPSPFLPSTSPILSKSRSKDDVDEERKEDYMRRMNQDEDESDDEIGLGVSRRSWRDESEEMEERDDEDEATGMKEVEL